MDTIIVWIQYKDQLKELVVVVELAMDQTYLEETG